MNLHQSRTGTILSFCGGALANVRGWTGRLASSVFSVFRRASGSKLFWLALAAVAVVIVVATLKFSTILHGLLRLAYVPKNVPLGPGIVGAGGSGAAGGASGKPPGPKPVPLPAPPTATPTPPPPPPPYNYPRFPGYPPNPPPANYPNPWVHGDWTQRTVTPDATEPGGYKSFYRGDSTGGKWVPTPPLRATPGDQPIDPKAFPSSGAGTKA